MRTSIGTILLAAAIVAAIETVGWVVPVALLLLALAIEWLAGQATQAARRARAQGVFRPQHRDQPPAPPRF